MIFGSKEHLQELKSLLHDDDYNLMLQYNIMQGRIDIVVIDKKTGMMSPVYISKELWLDRDGFNDMISKFKMKYKHARDHAAAMARKDGHLN